MKFFHVRNKKENAIYQRMILGLKKLQALYQDDILEFAN